MKKSILVVVMLVIVSLVYTVDVQAGLTDGLIAHYSFNGNANDKTGNGHNGTVSGATPTTDRFGSSDSAYSFDGSDDYIQIINTSDFRFSNESFSVSLWTQIIDNGPYQQIFAFADASDGLPLYSIAKARAGFLHGGVYTELWEQGAAYPSPGQSLVMSIDDGEELPKNEWLHLVSIVDYQAGKLKFYLNNSTQGTVDLIEYDLSAATTLEAYIGYSAYWGQPHHGLIDDVCIYDRALTETEVGQLYTIPEPATLLLFGLGIPMVSGLQKNAKRI